MNAYYTTNNGYDAIIIPAAGVAYLGFTDEDARCFLSGENPEFDTWTGDNCCDIAKSEQDEFDIAETYGEIIAQRVSGSSEARFLSLGNKHDELLALMG